MTLEVDFPRVLEPHCLEDLSTVYYQSMYENKDEAKKLIENLNNYCLELNFNEKAYMYTYMAKAQHVAKRVKKINRRNFVRKGRAKFNKKVSLEEVTINKNRYLEKLEEIKDCELERFDKELENKIMGIERRRKIIRRGEVLIPPATSGASLFISSNYLPAKIAGLIASGVGLGTFAAFYLLDKREIKKIEKTTDNHYEKRRKTIHKICEDQTGIEKYYNDRKKQIQEEYSNEFLVIEKDKESEKERHVSRAIEDLEKASKTYRIDLEGRIDLIKMMKMIG